MKLLGILKLTLLKLRASFTLSLVMVLCVAAAEGLQHVVEYYLGMYESEAAFRDKQSSTLRLSFGVLKAVSVVTACYIVPKNLSQAYGPPPQFGSFRADMVRKLWDPRGGIWGIISMLALVAPLIFLHMKLNFAAMGHNIASVLLILDSFLIGSLALVMGTSIWANDSIEHKYREAA